MANIHISFDKPVPAIVQDSRTGQVLMLGYMDREAYLRTLDTGVVWFWSRSRERLWKKGETSGNILKVNEVRHDCDADAILLLVEPTGPTCHTGQLSCFHYSVDPESHNSSGPLPLRPFFADSDPLSHLSAVIRQRHREMPEGSYTAYLLREGIDKVAKKLGEEVAEVIVASKNGERQRIVEEAADLMYHLLVMLEATGTEISEVYAELARRGSLSLEARKESHDH